MSLRVRFVMLTAFFVLLAIGCIYLVGYMTSLGSYEVPAPWWAGPTEIVGIILTLLCAFGAICSGMAAYDYWEGDE